MEIKLNLNAGTVPQVSAPKPPARGSQQTGRDATEFPGAQALEEALAQTPDARPDVVQHAQRLVGDPSYPPRETIQKLAALLAMQSES